MGLQCLTLIAATHLFSILATALSVNSNSYPAGSVCSLGRNKGKILSNHYWISRYVAYAHHRQPPLRCLIYPVLSLCMIADGLYLPNNPVTKCMDTSKTQINKLQSRIVLVVTQLVQLRNAFVSNESKVLSCKVVPRHFLGRFLFYLQQTVMPCDARKDSPFRVILASLLTNLTLPITSAANTRVTVRNIASPPMFK